MVKPLLKECIAEAVGTWLLVFIGTATVATAVTTGAQVGLWQVVVVWGFGATLAIFLSAHVSGAHLNPAVTIALGLTTPDTFPRCKIAPYIAAQLVGSIASGLLVWMLYGSAIARYEKMHNITRGEENSTLSAMVFGEYFPNPQVVHSGFLQQEDISVGGAMAIEAVGTFLLMLMIRGLTDETNGARPASHQAPFYIGFTIATIMSIVAPLTQGGLNPARDFGPRLVAVMAGWSSVAIPGPSNGFWIYIVGPILGAVVGSCLYSYVVQLTYVSGRNTNVNRRGSQRDSMGIDTINKSQMNTNPRVSSPRSSRVYQQFSDLA